MTTVASPPPPPAVTAPPVLERPRPGPAETGVWIAIAAISMTFAALTSAMVVRGSAAPDWRHFRLPPILYFNTRLHYFHRFIHLCRGQPILGAGSLYAINMQLACQRIPPNRELLEVLLQPDQQSKGPDLPAVGMSGELQIDVERRGAQDRPRLVREEQENAGAIALRQGLCQILAMAGKAAPSRRRIVDASQIKSRAFAFDRYPFISQYANPQPRNLRHPLLGARVG